MTDLKTVWLATVERPNEARRHRVFAAQAQAQHWAKRERGSGPGTWTVQIVMMAP